MAGIPVTNVVIDCKQEITTGLIAEGCSANCSIKIFCNAMVDGVTKNVVPRFNFVALTRPWMLLSYRIRTSCNIISGVILENENAKRRYYEHCQQHEDFFRFLRQV